MTWQPPMRFGYVTVLPEYVPEDRLQLMLTRIFDLFLQKRGRLVVSCYFPRPPGIQRTGAASELLRDLGFMPTGHSDVRREDGSLWTSVAWLDR